MTSIDHRMLSRRGFCLCCAAAASFTTTGGWLSPSQAYAEARSIVDLILTRPPKRSSRTEPRTGARRRWPALLTRTSTTLTCR